MALTTGMHWRQRLALTCDRHPIVAYVLLTYALSWAFLIPFVWLWNTVLERRLAWWHLIFLPGGYGPSIAAVIMAGVTRGRTGVQRLLGKLLLWRASWRWYLFAALTPFVALTLAVSLSSFRGSAWAAFSPGELLISVPIALLIALPFGPLAEELGWRGFALPRLQQRFSPVASSLILGVIWTFWHTPMFWFPGAAIPSFLDLTWYAVLLYLALTIAESLLHTALFNNSGGRVPLAILLHLTCNAAANALLPQSLEVTRAEETQMYVLNILILMLIAILVQRFLPGTPVREPEG
jgi:membrane protease YdiL (CAAX protease family)